jgi:class I fructose-bisphosphate aldolase
MLEAGADTFAGQIPTILKVNSANSLMSDTAGKDQAITASVDDALRLGCAAIGFTIYPGLGHGARHVRGDRRDAPRGRRRGIATVIWSYPRGEGLTKDGETAIDVGAYAAQIAALLGAHIIKVKLDRPPVMQPEAKKVYEAQGDRHLHPGRAGRRMRALGCFAGAIVVFSGGAKKGADAVYDDARAIRDGGGNGSIIGRNSFQRSREDALAMLGKLIDIYKGNKQPPDHAPPTFARISDRGRACLSARPSSSSRGRTRSSGSRGA